MRQPGRRNIRRRGSCTRPGAFIARCTGSAVGDSCGPPRTNGGWGSLRLTTVGRKSGQERRVIIGYLEDGPNFVALAMNGWDEGRPAWWLNLEAHPDAVIRLADKQPRPVRARLSAGEERDRLWQRWVAADPRIEAFAGRRSTKTPVIVLEPRNQTPDTPDDGPALIR